MRKDEYEFVAILSAADEKRFARETAERPDAKPRKGAHQIADDALTLIRYGRTLHGLAERACNGYHDDDEANRDDAKARRLEEKAGKIAAEYGGTVETQGDPRGACLRLHLPTGVYNTWGGMEAGYAVPP